jgi:uroporphyrinogen-III synthase
MRRVLVTRPEPGATRTLNALQAHGIDAVSIPLTEIQRLNFETPNAEFDVLIITSQNAVVHGAVLLAQHKAKPVFAVGKRTAEVLQSLGHAKVEWATTAQELLQMIIRCSPKTALYICGQTRRPELETGLATAKIPYQTVEVYSAARMRNVRQMLLAFLAGCSNPIILFYAPSAAEAFVIAMDGQYLPVSVRFLCMSAAISAQLPENWHMAVTLAGQPDDAAMITQLDKMLA